MQKKIVSLITFEPYRAIPLENILKSRQPFQYHLFLIL